MKMALTSTVGCGLVFWGLLYAFQGRLWAASLEVPSGSNYKLAAGRHEFETLKISGTLELQGDTEIRLTGNPFAPTEPALVVNRGIILGSGAVGERGQDGIDGEPGTDGVRGTSPSDLGSGGRRGSDATSGGNGSPGGNGYVLKLIVFGHASLADGFILMDGGSGGGGGKGGQGGVGGTWGGGAYIGAPIFPGGSGGNGGDGGNGARGGDGGRLWLTVMESFTMSNSLISAVGGRGGSGNLGGAGGMVGGQPGSGYPSGTLNLPAVGNAGLGGWGDAGGTGGEVHLFVGADFFAQNSKIPTVTNALPAYKIEVSGGMGGWGSTDSDPYYPREYGRCFSGPGGRAGRIEVLVKGRLEERSFPMLANGGSSGLIYTETGLAALAGGRGGYVSCQALGGIFWSTPQLYYGATGGEGGPIGGTAVNQDHPATPGWGGDGGLIEIKAKTLEYNHAPIGEPFIPGASAGLGGMENITGVRTNSGSPGHVLITLSPPVLTPEIQVLDGERVIQNGEGPLVLTPSGNETLISRTFTVKNLGTAPLHITRLEVPPGFKVTEGLEEYVLAGGDSDTFTLAQTTADAALSTGKIHIEHNDGRANPFEFSVTVQSGASLSAKLSGKTLTLSWRVTGQNQQLQVSPALGPHTSWSAFPNAPSVADGIATVPIAIGPSCSFYRLGP